MRVSSESGALKERFYTKRIYLQVLKTAKQKKVEVREFLRAEELRDMWDFSAYY
jgi:hypothetical protein